MPTPRYDDVKDIPLATDARLIPHLVQLLAPSLRRQAWVSLLDSDARPLPDLYPIDINDEPHPDDIEGWADMLRCLSWDHQTATLVIVFERPGPAQLVDNDRRWLRLLCEAVNATGCDFRGPFALLGSKVLPVEGQEYLGIPWAYSGDGDEEDGDDGADHDGADYQDHEHNDQGV